MMNAAEFAKYALRKSRLRSSFAPFASYDRDGDCIEFIAAPESYFAERIDATVTVYYSEDTKKIVGAQIKGVSKLLKKCPGLAIEIRDGEVQLHLLLRARIWNDSMPRSILVQKYKKLIELAEENQTQVDLNNLVPA